VSDISTTIDLVPYDQVRASIEDGDVLLFRGSMLTSEIIKRVSSGVYSHAALALWWGDRLMLCQAVNNGVEAVPMRVALGGYEGAADWYKLHPAARAGINYAALGAEAKADLGKPYSHVGLIAEGAHVLMGTALPNEGAVPTAFLCSQYVARCFRKAGLPLTDKEDIDTSPTDLATSDLLALMGTLSV
jgi:hypothetical protein